MTYRGHRPITSDSELSPWIADKYVITGSTLSRYRTAGIQLQAAFGNSNAETLKIARVSCSPEGRGQE